MRGKRTALVIAQGERGFYESAPCMRFYCNAERWPTWVMTLLAVAGPSPCSVLARS